MAGSCDIFSRLMRENCRLKCEIQTGSWIMERLVCDRMVFIDFYHFSTVIWWIIASPVALKRAENCDNFSALM